ncbi:hypothetical protein MSAN_02464100 [Mycena sanguinolenta]|uniref:Uncharacterized protein n=1 Tax=Mycena sanguinolenta TaxID=230812 RepID=A0A8H6WWV9_9AGAR|nr:hypothetical protein MSAN_02464100 [Mycena sanguinolenta]
MPWASLRPESHLEESSSNMSTEPEKTEEKSNITDPTTFVCPSLTEGTTVTIEFCDRCRWLHRASWVQTELLLTFPPPVISCIALLPRYSDETAGRFRVWVTCNGGEGQAATPQLAWDRKSRGRLSRVEGFETEDTRYCATREKPWAL